MPGTATQVVVTGVGATTPLGGDARATWSALLAGDSGIGAFDVPPPWTADQLPVRIVAPVAVDPSAALSPKQVRHTDRATQLALVAVAEGWADAGFTAPASSGDSPLDPVEVGAVVSCGMAGLTSMVRQYELLVQRGADGVSPYCIPMMIPNAPSAEAGLLVGARAGVHAPVSACAAGAEAIAYGVQMIRSGRAKVVVAGGADATIHPLVLAGFARMGALSCRNDDPPAASRPFDTGRDGFVLGEGAGVLVLEDAEHARARNARVYCELAGYGLAADCHHIAQPDPSGAGVARAVTAALRDAGTPPAEVTHVNAHATSTPLGDVAEAGAIRRALGRHADVPCVSATKSSTGHLIGGAGGVESVLAALTVHHRVAPPTTNLVDLDPAVGLDVVGPVPRPLPAGPITALNNAMGFGGHDVSLLLRSC
ncbi:beta-ketoacyl-[acyl-carrier-protein] synthase family protein [Actinosynnema sp. NPDC050436]|uniref:beta-ketoacyl-[acyl-carrier-protein] synthase family protein n=1 Tax=Actinosynnema sp. NPDC050436 TaxID=3155659 RepID=UPI0033D9AD62